MDLSEFFRIFPVVNYLDVYNCKRFDCLLIGRSRKKYFSSLKEKIHFSSPRPLHHIKSEKTPFSLFSKSHFLKKKNPLSNCHQHQTICHKLWQKKQTTPILSASARGQSRAGSLFNIILTELELSIHVYVANICPLRSS